LPLTNLESKFVIIYVEQLYGQLIFIPETLLNHII
jgi:hypothetical protein